MPFVNLKKKAQSFKCLFETHSQRQINFFVNTSIKQNVDLSFLTTSFELRPVLKIMQ